MTSKENLSEEQDSEKPQSSIQKKRADSPEPSCVSLKSEDSMEKGPSFREKDCSTELSSWQGKRSDSPDPSRVSTERDQSLYQRLEFRNSCFSEPSSIQNRRADPPEPSWVSTKSEDSMEKGPSFRDCSTELSPASNPDNQSVNQGINFKNVSWFSKMSSYQNRRADPPEPSCVSMKSEDSMEKGPSFRETDCSTELRSTHDKRSNSPNPSSVSMENNQSVAQAMDFINVSWFSKMSSIQNRRADPPEPSCVSTKSEDSMEKGPSFREADCSTELRTQNQTLNLVSESELDCIFGELEHKSISLLKNQLNRFKKLLSPEYQACPEKETEDKEHQSSVSEGALKITLHVLESMNHKDLANSLQIQLAPACLQKHKLTLKERFQKINEGISHHATSRLLNDIYTDLYITDDGSGEVNNEHELRQIETASRKPAQETSVKWNDIFKNYAVRTVLTKGIGGIGKSIFVQKFILDWAEGKSNQDIHFIFPLPFRELNLLKNQNLSLEQLLHHFFSDTKQLTPSDYGHLKVLFIFDGLDESQLPLDFQNNKRLTSVTQVASVDALVTNLIKGKLLPTALLWITSRPAAVSQIPIDCIDQVIVVQGFNDFQKEEYFIKKIIDESLANRIITHMKSSRSLYIMCHIPVFCWIATTVLEEMLGDSEIRVIPRTLTQMFVHFLIFQIKQTAQKYQGKTKTEPDQIEEIVWKLGKLAFQNLEENNLIFYEEDLRHFGIEVSEVPIYSGLFTQIFSKNFGLHLGKVFSFVHQTVQEFLAALYAFVSFISHNRNVLEHQTGLLKSFGRSMVSDFLKHAVKKALQSKTGHLDLFLQFLLGLSLESNRTLLRGLVPKIASRYHSEVGTVNFIKRKIRENASTEKSINLFHCLNELNDHSLVQEIQSFLSTGGCHCLSGVKLSPTQWSALVFILLNSDEQLDEFELTKYDPSEECLQRLFPVVKASSKALLRSCNLTMKSCAVLASALSSSPCNLRELDLAFNKLQDSGAELLSTGLKNPLCKLEILRLCNCNLSERSCAFLASVLSSNSSSLKELDLSNNKLHDSGVKELSTGLENPHCKLEILRLCCCNLSEESCAVMASGLNSDSSCLRDLDLSGNKLQDSGVKLLSTALDNQHCKLEKLGLFNCSITEDGCGALVTALKSNPSLPLRYLDLKDNQPGDSKMRELLALQEDPQHKLKTLLI